MSSGQGEGKDSAGKVAIVSVIGVILIGICIWMMLGKVIVTSSTPWLYKASAIWNFFGKTGEDTRLELFRAGGIFIARGGDVSADAYFQYLQLAIRPYTIIFGAFWILLGAWVMLSPASTTNRRFNSDLLLQELSKTFTATIPVHHLRSDLVADKDPRWARQTWPEEVFERFRGQKGARMLVNRSLNEATAREYFWGVKPQRFEGRLDSKMLGRQVVDILEDSKDPKKLKATCFSDRMSDIGRVVFAILVARSFGGKEGVSDAKTAMDQLNRSCAGAAHGLPNISVAEWLYKKYRKNEKARRLFQVHHWEYTYLYALFFKAKEPGKVTVNEFLWLKPADRVMFYALENCCRFVPCIESAAVFNHHAYELGLARLGRLPYKEVGGKLVPVIFCDNAVDGLRAYTDHWIAGGDDPRDPWLDSEEIWNRATNFHVEAEQKLKVAYALLPPSGEMSPFDLQQIEERKKSASRESAQLNSEIALSSGLGED